MKHSYHIWGQKVNKKEAAAADRDDWVQDFEFCTSEMPLNVPHRHKATQGFSTLHL